MAHGLANEDEIQMLVDVAPCCDPATGFPILSGFTGSFRITGMLIFLGTGMLHEYRKKSTMVNVKLLTKDLPFPAVTVCNLNPSKKSAAMGIPILSALEAKFVELSQSSLTRRTNFSGDHPPPHPYEGRGQCPVLFVNNGVVAYALNGNVDARRFPGTIAIVHCQREYMVQEKPNPICENGNWSTDIPQCTKKCQQIYVQYGTVKVTYSSPILIDKTKAEISCAEGFISSDKEGNSSLLTCVSDGENVYWNGTQPLCSKSCGNLFVKRWTREFEGNYAEGVKAHFYCENGSWLFDTNDTHLINVFRSPTTFNAVTDFMLQEALENAGPCPGIVIPAADIQYSDEKQLETSWDKTKPGYMAQINCKNENKMQSLQCKWIKDPIIGYKNRTLVWLKDDNKPMDIECGIFCELLLVDKANVTYSKASIVAGTIAAIECQQGFANFGPTKTECSMDGVWTFQPMCKRSCPEFSVDSRNMPITLTMPGRPIGSVALFDECIPDTDPVRYKVRLTSYREVSCLESFNNDTQATEAQWDLIPPTCSESCLPIETKSNMKVTYESHLRLVGFKAMVECQSEKELVIGDSISVCEPSTLWDFPKKKTPYCEEFPTDIMKTFNTLNLSQELVADGLALFSTFADIQQTAIRTLQLKELEMISQPLHEMIPKCYYEGKPCDKVSNFTKFPDPSLGKCHQFNIADDGMLRVQQPGPLNGLKLHLFVNHSEYMISSERVGIQLMIHQQNFTVTSDAAGLRIPMGYKTNVGINYFERKKLEISSTKSSRSCVDNPKIDKHTMKLIPNSIPFFYNTAYSQDGCIHSIKQIFVFQKCKCGATMLPLPSDLNYCTFGPQKKCMEKFIDTEWSSLISNASAICPEPCRTKVYESSVSYSLWPSTKLLQRLHRTRADVDVHKSFKIFAKQFRRTNALVQVFYRDMTGKVYNEQLRYPFINFVSHIGSQMSIWLGMSVLSLAEVIQLFLKLISFLFKRQNSKYNKVVNSSQGEKSIKF